jgi:hypothetical protein
MHADGARDPRFSRRENDFGVQRASEADTQTRARLLCVRRSLSRSICKKRWRADHIKD